MIKGFKTGQNVLQTYFYFLTANDTNNMIISIYDVRYFPKGLFPSGNFPRVFSQVASEAG